MRYDYIQTRTPYRRNVPERNRVYSDLELKRLDLEDKELVIRHILDVQYFKANSL